MPLTFRHFPRSMSALFVGRLPSDCRARELEDFFGKYGRLTRCDIKRGKR